MSDRNPRFNPDQVQPTREIVFIERAVEDDRFGDSPIIRPDTIRAEMGLALVRAIGPDVKNIKVGDQVYLGKLSGLKITELGGPFFLVNQAEILAVIRYDR